MEHQWDQQSMPGVCAIQQDYASRRFMLNWTEPQSIYGSVTGAVVQKLRKIILPKIKPKLWLIYRQHAGSHQAIWATTNFHLHKRCLHWYQVLLANRTWQQFTLSRFAHHTDKYRHVGNIHISQSTYTDQVLQFRSNHPKKLFDRAQSDCNTEERKKEEKDYPFQVILHETYTRSIIRRGINKKRHRDGSR